jgi:two-component system invasion response regulator UvrY
VIKILLVDDHDLVRAGIKRMLEDAPAIKVVGEARTGEEAIKLARELQPNVVLMDVKLPDGMDGLEATKRLLRQDPDIKVIALTVFDNDVYPSRLIEAGAMGYLTKGTSVDEMIQAIRAVYFGQRYVTAEVANQIALKRLNDYGEAPFDDLSERELQVMMMITRGAKPIEIAKKLELSPKTINSYRYRIFDKLNVQNDVELTHLALQYGFLDEEQVTEAV